MWILVLQRRLGGRWFECAWFRHPVTLRSERWYAVLAIGPWSLVLAQSLLPVLPPAHRLGGKASW